MYPESWSLGLQFAGCIPGQGSMQPGMQPGMQLQWRLWRLRLQREITDPRTHAEASLFAMYIHGITSKSLARCLRPESESLVVLRRKQQRECDILPMIHKKGVVLFGITSKFSFSDEDTRDIFKLFKNSASPEYQALVRAFHAQQQDRRRSGLPP